MRRSSRDVTGGKEIRPAHPEEIRQYFGADAGSLGPVGVKNMRIVADLALQGRRNMIAGANENDYHLKNVTPGEDFQAEFFDLRQVAQGDTELETGAPLEIRKSVEIGHIFKLGYKYSEAMGLKVTNESRRRSDSHHGVIRHRSGAHSLRGDRVVCRQRRHLDASRRLLLSKLS